MLLLMKSSMYIHCYDLKVLSHKATCCRDKITYMTHDATLQHIACNTPVLSNGTDNELTIKMASQGRPMIGLFTELSQRHVASACRTRGRNESATFCCRNVPWIQTFEFMWHIAATRCDVELHKNIHVTRGNLSRGHVAATGHLVWQELKSAHSTLVQISCRPILDLMMSNHSSDPGEYVFRVSFV